MDSFHALRRATVMSSVPSHACRICSGVAFFGSQPFMTNIDTSVSRDGLVDLCDRLTAIVGGVGRSLL